MLRVSVIDKYLNNEKYDAIKQPVEIKSEIIYLIKSCIPKCMIRKYRKLLNQIYLRYVRHVEIS